MPSHMNAIRRFKGSDKGHGSTSRVHIATNCHQKKRSKDAAHAASGRSLARSLARHPSIHPIQSFVQSFIHRHSHVDDRPRHDENPGRRIRLEWLRYDEALMSPKSYDLWHLQILCSGAAGHNNIGCSSRPSPSPSPRPPSSSSSSLQ